MVAAKNRLEQGLTGYERKRAAQTGGPLRVLSLGPRFRGDDEEGKHKKQRRPRGTAARSGTEAPEGVLSGNHPNNSCSSFFAISSMFSGGQPGMSIPSRSPIELSTSLISFRLLRPKFGVRSISASVFCTRSPM